MTDQTRRFPQLDPDAPAVPPGKHPRPGVEMGCGEATCADCYADAPERPADATYVRAARRLHHKDGTLEIDLEGRVVTCDDGAYVLAWVYVADAEVTAADTPTTPATPAGEAR